MSTEGPQDDLWAPLSPEEVAPSEEAHRSSRRSRRSSTEDFGEEETRTRRRVRVAETEEPEAAATPKQRSVGRKSVLAARRATATQEPETEVKEPPASEHDETEKDKKTPPSNKRLAMVAGAAVLTAAIGFGGYVLFDTYRSSQDSEGFVTNVTAPLEIGSTGTISLDGTDLVDITLTGFGPTSCVDSDGQPFTPTKGRFVVIDLLVQTKDFDATGAELDRWYIGDDRTPAVTNETASCIPLVTADLSPNTESTVQVVLDIPTDSTNISFESLNPLPVSMSWVVPEGASFNPFTGDDGFGDE